MRGERSVQGARLRAAGGSGRPPPSSPKREQEPGQTLSGELIEFTNSAYYVLLTRAPLPSSS